MQWIEHQRIRGYFKSPKSYNFAVLTWVNFDDKSSVLAMY